MDRSKKQAFVRLLGMGGLVSAALISLGCSSSNSTSTPGTGGGSGGKGGSGSGGTSGGGGTSGPVDAGPVYGCAMSDPPPSPLIADFVSADGGVELTGGFSAYGSNAVDLPSYSLTGGVFNITDAVVTSSGYQYVGVVLYFSGNTGGTDCVDASAYAGIEFSLSGTLMGTGCSLSYSTQDSEHSAVVIDPSTGKPTDPKASGAVGIAGSSYAPQLNILPAMLTTTPQTIKVPFDDSSLQPGVPTAGIDPKKITGAQWQLTVPPTGDSGGGECDLNVTIDNVTFYSN